MDASRIGRHRFLAKLAAVFTGVAAAAIVAAPAAAEAGWGQRSPGGGWGGFGPGRGRPAYHYQERAGRRYSGGDARRGHVAPATGSYVPQPRLYVPPVRVYYGPPGGYVPPMTRVGVPADALA